MSNYESELTALDVAIERGLADANAGRVKPAQQVFDRLEAKYRAQLDLPRREQSRS